MPTFKHRVVMLDPARQMDLKAEFDFLLPWLARWGYNTLHWHFADDEGCRLTLPSHPELASPGALSPTDMRDLIAHADDLGLRVIPELESLGHTRFITSLPRFRALGSPPSHRGFNSLDPENKKVHRLLNDLFHDVAEIFPAQVIHVGLDEVNLRSLPRYKNITADQSAQLFAAHALRVHEIVRSLGKRPAMWGDHLLLWPKTLKAIGKDVLIFDWHYEPQVHPSSLDTFTGAGFEVWACPATMCWLARVLPHEGDFANVRQMTAFSLQRRQQSLRKPGDLRSAQPRMEMRGRLGCSQGVTGMVNTVWCPYRYLPGAMDYPIAWAGHVFSAAAEDPDFAARFAADFYRLPARDARACAQALRDLHAAALPSRDYDAIVLGRHGDITFHRDHARLGSELAQRCRLIASSLRPLVRRARRNAQRLNDVLLSALILQRVGLFAAAHRRKRHLPNGKSLTTACRKAWSRTRVDDPQTRDDHAPSAQRLFTALKAIS
ncbi:MAG: family 20 glycosylhydrolase [Phycisphaeraceae bacterium]|nr:family 20 glycosylhydrolase [Phycisphaeraceae bacterium]